MKLGLTIFPTDSSIAPAELAAAAEERGFESLWFPEHSHIPASRRTPFPGGGELPRITNLVDIINWCSAESHLPFGLYDLDRISGPVTARLGRPGGSVHPRSRRLRPVRAGRWTSGATP